MSSALEIDGKVLYPIREIVKSFSYSRDYITRLARSNKIDASYVGRQWFVNPESLERYVEAASLEQELRRKKLSIERKQEQQVKFAVAEKQKGRENRVRTLRVKVVTATCLIVGLGLMGGAAAVQAFPNLATVVLGAKVATLAGTKTVITTSGTNKQEANLSSSVSEENQRALVLQEVPEKVVTSMGDVREGVLLLPAGGAVDSFADFFSDEVEVRTAADGRQAVVRIDEYGQPIGQEIPLVSVPVGHVDE